MNIQGIARMHLNFVTTYSTEATSMVRSYRVGAWGRIGFWFRGLRVCLSQRLEGREAPALLWKKDPKFTMVRGSFPNQSPMSPQLC